MNEVRSAPAATNKPRVAFAVTSQGRDLFAAMARVAVASLRLSNPDVFVTVVCDAETNHAIVQTGNQLIDEVDEWLVLPTPQGGADYRSRYVKTSLRSAIDGPFLYLDADVLVRGDLSKVFTIDTDIAAARNRCRLTLTEQLPRVGVPATTVEAMGWSISPEVYLNSGVHFFNDTRDARSLGKEWHRRWRLVVAKLGDYHDQPAFNSAWYELKPRTTILSDRFNAMFPDTPATAPDAVIWHYCHSHGKPPYTQFALLARDLVSGGRLDLEQVAALMESPHPWRRDSCMDDRAAAQVIRCNDFHGGWGGAWLRREALRYVSRRPRALLGRLKRVIMSR